MSVTIYHNPRCSKSRDTLALLEGRGLAPVVVEYLDTPPSVAELTRILALLGLKARDLVRAKDAKDRGIDPNALAEEDLIRCMVETPAIIERPIVVADGKAAIGRPPEAVLAIL